MKAFTLFINLILVLALVGCGGAETGDGDEGGVTSPETAPASQESEEATDADDADEDDDDDDDEDDDDEDDD